MSTPLEASIPQNPAFASEEHLFQHLEAYPWSTDAEFQSGLRAILGSTPPREAQEGSQQDELILQAKCFYYSRYERFRAQSDGRYPANSSIHVTGRRIIRSILKRTNHGFAQGVTPPKFLLAQYPMHTYPPLTPLSRAASSQTSPRCLLRNNTLNPNRNPANLLRLRHMPQLKRLQQQPRQDHTLRPSLR
jgi:hypothetical protein